MISADVNLGLVEFCQLYSRSITTFGNAISFENAFFASMPAMSLPILLYIVFAMLDEIVEHQEGNWVISEWLFY